MKGGFKNPAYFIRVNFLFLFSKEYHIFQYFVNSDDGVAAQPALQCVNWIERKRTPISIHDWKAAKFKAMQIILGAEFVQTYINSIAQTGAYQTTNQGQGTEVLLPASPSFTARPENFSHSLLKLSLVIDVIPGFPCNLNEHSAP